MSEKTQKEKYNQSLEFRYDPIKLANQDVVKLNLRGVPVKLLIIEVAVGTYKQENGWVCKAIVKGGTYHTRLLVGLYNPKSRRWVLDPVTNPENTNAKPEESSVSDESNDLATPFSLGDLFDKGLGGLWDKIFKSDK